MKKSKFKSVTIGEASDFFDEHDIFEFDDVREVKDTKFNLGKKKYIGVDIELNKKKKKKDKKLNIYEDALIKEWLEEKVA